MPPLILVLLVFAGVTALLSAMLAAIVRHFTKRRGLSILVGGLALPMLLLASTFYMMVSMEADDPAPGNVILGTLAALAVMIPVGLLASLFTVRWLSGRRPQHGNQNPQ